jgi:glycosyltransferase involved in cell wall biosynthesis
MRIAQVAPLVESVPPRLYGGTERVIAGLVAELTALGHEVTLYASGDSDPGTARLVSVVERALWAHEIAPSDVALHVVELANVHRDAGGFDVVHSHLDVLGLLAGRFSSTPFVHTLHGRLDLPETRVLLEEFSDAPLISISDSQRRPVPKANWLATVHNGIPLSDISVGEGNGGYLAFIGRVSPEKGVAEAIDLAHRVGMPLKIAARMPLASIDNDWVRADWTYYVEQIKPRLANSQLVEFVGEVDDQGKYALLQDAAALVFPINWPEPFGLVMVEALACGTPVIARAMASTPEVVRHGETGFLCRDLDEMVAAVRALPSIDREACRADAEERFSARAMALGYLAAYERLLNDGPNGVNGHDRLVRRPLARELMPHVILLGPAA